MSPARVASLVSIVVVWVLTVAPTAAAMHYWGFHREIQPGGYWPEVRWEINANDAHWSLSAAADRWGQYTTYLRTYRYPGDGCNGTPHSTEICQGWYGHEATQR